jgi:chaperonin GroEL
MSAKKVKEAAKIFTSNEQFIQKKVSSTLTKISDIVGKTLGPAGRVIGIEGDYYGLPNKMTKDGVTVFNSLSAEDPFEQLIIEQTRSAAGRTASEAGDGTTTATILSASLTNNLLKFCNDNKTTSPQKVVRVLNKLLRSHILPEVERASIKVGYEHENMDLLLQVAKISANGDDEMAEAVIKAFETVGFGENSHVTIQETSGQGGYEIDLIEGFPIQMGYEETVGKFHTAFINDQGNLRCALDKPIFILFDGIVSDLVALAPIFDELGGLFQTGESDTKNIVLAAHGFGEAVLHNLAANFSLPNTINVVPLLTPMTAVINSRLNFLYDLSAFTGAKVFGLTNNIRDWKNEDFGRGMEKFEFYRFRATVVGKPDEMDIETRADVLRKQLEAPESIQAKLDMEERLGKLTTGIAKLTIYAGSSGELKEKHDRCEDAVCAVRATITDGALPGGCRVLVNVAMLLQSAELSEQDAKIAKSIIVPSLLAPISKLLDNAGYALEEQQGILAKIFTDQTVVYDVENQVFGTARELGVFDAAKAVKEALKNSFSIASTMGVLGGMICFPRDSAQEWEHSRKDSEWRDAMENPTQYADEVNDRI